MSSRVARSERFPESLGPASVRFTPDGRRLFVLDDTGTGQRWEVSPDAWSRHACRVAGRGLTRAEWEQVIPGQSYRRVCSSYRAPASPARPARISSRHSPRKAS